MQAPSSSSVGSRRGRKDEAETSDDAHYDAFISYSHAADGQLAPALQAGLQSLGNPWYRRRALRVFRDKTSLSASPELWSSIEGALAASRYFVLLASPKAAASRWVDQEVRWWLEHRSPTTMLIVLTGGEVAWDDAHGGFDPARSTALPPAALGWPGTEPLWVDLRWARKARHVSLRDPRFREVVADLAAPLRGLPKDELIGEDIRQHRRTMRLARTAVGTLVVLLVATMVGALVAVNQRDNARDQARIATARQLAATSGALLSTRLDLAQLFAARAYRMDPNQQTRTALFQAVTSSPQLVRYLPMGGHVAELAGSGDGQSVVAGLDDGRVLRWALAEQEPHTVFDLRDSISSLSVSRDGTVVVASDKTNAMLWQQGRPVVRIKPPPGHKPGAVGLAPSGRTAAVQSSAPGSHGGSIVIFDVPSGTIKATHDDPHEGLAFSSLLVMPSDNEMLLLDGGYGGWQRRRIPGWALEAT